MPRQETFFEQQTGDRKVEVLKTYDQSYAREAFESMDEISMQKLWDTLRPEAIYDAEGLPKLNDPNDVNGEAQAFLWDELVEQALEDPRAYPRATSFFIVNESRGNINSSLYVSPDWPSAEAFAKARLADEALSE
ncbi:hypothetical protein ACFQBQ_03550 [Granulicella cerasi]|uniref:Uncharacterized protein n=1 Tax=Granulicella cerasi TaxID=741063 RepID=A0ABW1Z534_9BACT|nr:hypothetical protein [Granulicella cerasi]